MMERTGTEFPSLWSHTAPVALRGGEGGPPRVTPSKGMTPGAKN